MTLIKSTLKNNQHRQSLLQRSIIYKYRKKNKQILKMILHYGF